MKKLLFGTTLLALVSVFPISTMAGVDINISIPIPLPPPPPFLLGAPPEVVVIPETYVYVAPDVDVDIFFYNGWWWRPWEGRWYRSRHYSSGWGYYKHTPSFYRGIPPGWRNDYRRHRWKGHHWHYKKIHNKEIHHNWRNWEKDRHWEKHNTWGVQGLKPRKHSRPQDREVQQDYRQHSEPHSKHQKYSPQQDHGVYQQDRKGQPHSREAVEPQHSEPRSKPQTHSRQQDRGVQQEQREVQPKSPGAAKSQHSESRHGKPKNGEKEKQDKK